MLMPSIPEKEVTRTGPPLLVAYDRYPGKIFENFYSTGLFIAKTALCP